MFHRIPRHWQAWLQDKGSLTQRLVHASDGNFEVRVVCNRWGIPCQSEANALMLKPRQKAIIREVELLCHGQVWVCARSIIPHSTLTGRLRQFKNIGTKPLGALLFKHPSMVRGALEVTSLKQRNSRQQHWARRSVFYLDDKGILVTEVFMPPMACVLPQGD
jgi:chorismate--pyruvate lyase